MAGFSPRGAGAPLLAQRNRCERTDVPRRPARTRILLISWAKSGPGRTRPKGHPDRGSAPQL